MLIKSIQGKNPSIPEDCFIAENATIIGEVSFGKECSVWYNAVVRGDVNSITIGNKVNIQDGAVIHCTYQKHSTVIGNNVSIGHNAIIHGAKVGNNVLIGMGAILMDNAVIPDNTIIAAGAVVLSNQVLEPGVYAGIPAKKVKEGSEAITAATTKNAQGYMMYKEWFLSDDYQDVEY